MQDLNVTLLQQPLCWQDPTANRAHFDRLLEEPLNTDLILLPEMFATGFSMDSEQLAETMEGDSVSWMRAQAVVHQSVVAGSLIIKEDGKHFNRLIWMQPDGKFECYDKRHLFRMANEQSHYQAGEQHLLTNIKGWRIAPMICYDLRFPVWCRNTDAYDLLIFVANWPAARRNHWRTLLRARAIENLAYSIGLNRIGKDGNGIEYAGDSAVIDPRGETLLDAEKKQLMQSIQLEAAPLREYREKFPAYLDADNFDLQKTDN